MNLNILEEKIKNNEINEAILMIEELGRGKCKEAVSLLIHHLINTENHQLRNIIALALSDIGDTKCIKPIIDILKNPKTQGNRGTLLYALEQFECSEHIELFVDLLINGNFEVSRQSYMLIKDINTKIPDFIIEKCINKIESEIEELEDKIDFLSESLELLKEKNTINHSVES